MENFGENSSPSIGLRIKAARKAKGLTLTQLGELIGITNQALSAIERGKARPSRQTLKSLSRVLNENFDGRTIIKLREPGFKYPGPARDFVSRLPNYEEEMFRRAEEAIEASRMPKPVRRSMVEVIYVPIHYEIMNGDTLSPYHEEDRVLAPAQMVPVLKCARAVRIIGVPMREAFANHGDCIILTECPKSLDNKVMLVEANGMILLRTWKTSGRKVKLIALNQKRKPVEVPTKNINCIGEVTGMLKSAYPSTLPVPVYGSWPIE